MRKAIFILIGFFLLFLVTINTFHDSNELTKIHTTVPVSPQLNQEELVEDKVQESDSVKNKGKQSGLQTFIGQTRQDIIAAFGEPSRIDMSAYGYNWWIYDDEIDQYMQVGISEGKVVTLYVAGDKRSTSPFQIGKLLQKEQLPLTFSSKVSLQIGDSSYRFELTDVEYAMKPLVKLDDVWVQIYIDTFTNEVSSVRYLDAETLIKQRPYELVYRGNLISPSLLTRAEWANVEKGSQKQILSITNVIRTRHNLKALKWNEQTSQVAFLHSKEMEKENYFSHESPNKGKLSDRLLSGGVNFKLAGENIAAQYIDGIAAVEGWLNSEGHRKALLNESFTHLGVGVYEKYYTQNFIETLVDEND